MPALSIEPTSGQNIPSLRLHWSNGIHIIYEAPKRGRAVKTKAFATTLVACVVLIVPISAWASPVEVFTLSGVSYSSPSGTLSGTFDYDGTNFSNIDITATGGNVGGDVFNTNNGSAAIALDATASNGDTLILDFASALPSSGGGMVDVTEGTVNSYAEYLADVASVPLPYPDNLLYCFLAGCGNEYIADAGSVSAPGATPLPASAPLFATGLGALGLLVGRRKRKNTAALAAA
jgi:hypothetical protein